MSVFGRWIDRLIVDLVSPCCIFCHGPCEKSLCSTCGQFEHFQGRCRSCGRPMRSVEGYCAYCESGRVGLQAIQSVYYLDGVSSEIMHRVKLGREPSWLKIFDSEVRLDADLGVGDNAWVVPVPLHWTRLLRRGFNQSDILARKIAVRHKLEYRPGVLKKVRSTPPQSRSSGKVRTKNLLGAFQWRFRGEAPPEIVLVDDIVTTGSTFTCCARAARKAGVKRIVAWALFRTKLKSASI